MTYKFELNEDQYDTLIFALGVATALQLNEHKFESAQMMFKVAQHVINTRQAN